MARSGVVVDLGLMEDEWDAWQVVVARWREAGLPDFNGETATPIVRAIQHWGERLVGLRVAQTPELRAQALAEAARAANLRP